LIDEGERAGWKRLKNYQAGDADWKEFLYPENWLEPEG
jgi:hypothetical protein